MNETGKVHTAHMECSVQHYIVGSALCCGAATSEVKELATPNPRIQQLCTEFEDVFAEPEMPLERDVTHDIVLQKGATPLQPRVYHKQPAELTELQRQLEEFLEKGWIRPSNSFYSAPILFYLKADGSLHMCIEQRALIKQTNKCYCPVPRIDDLLDRLLGAKYFSKLDLVQGYHQVAITPGHEYKTAFISRYGLFEFTVLPIGLYNAPSTFWRMMNNGFRDDLDLFLYTYMTFGYIVLRWMSMQLTQEQCLINFETINYMLKGRNTRLL